MSDTQVTQLVPRARQSSPPGQVKGRLKAALNSMAHDGLTDNQAAVKSGITVQAIRIALQKPHVRAYYRMQCEVFRESLRGRASTRMLELSEQSLNLSAAVVATKALMAEPEQDVARAMTRPSAGVTIVIQSVGQSVGNSSPVLDLPAISSDVEG